MQYNILTSLRKTEPT